MKRTAILAAAAVALSACTTTDIDAGIRKSLPQICDGAQTAFAVLQPFIVAGKLSAKTEAAAISAHESLFDGEAALCKRTDSVTLATVLVAASAAALTISTAVREAKRAQ